MIPIYKPYFTKKSLSYVHDAIDSTWISSHGKYLPLAEERLKEITNSKFIILTNNGTAATHLVAISLNLKYPKIDKLIVPSNVYIAAWNMFKVNPSYEFIPIDANINTWNFDYESEKFEKAIKKNKDSVGVLAVHNIGNIINVPYLKNKYRDIPFIEDNCEGFLGKYIFPANQQKIQSGKASLSYSLSFFGNKTITSGEGGAFCTDDEEIYDEINRIRAHGLTSEKFVFDQIGYNYRMTNIQAAILYGQLEIIDEIIYRKSKIFRLYEKHLYHDNIEFMDADYSTIPSNWMFGIRLTIPKEKILQLQLHLHYNNIETRPMFPPINYHKHYSNFGDNFPISKLLYETVIILPSYPELTETEIKYICKTIIDFLNK